MSSNSPRRQDQANTASAPTPSARPVRTTASDDGSMGRAGGATSAPSRAWTCQSGLPGGRLAATSVVQTTVGTAVLGKEPARYLPASRNADRPFRYTAHDRPMTTPGCRSMARCKSDCPVAPLPGYPLNLTAPLTLVRVRRCRLWWLRLNPDPAHSG